MDDLSVKAVQSEIPSLPDEDLVDLKKEFGARGMFNLADEVNDELYRRHPEDWLESPTRSIKMYRLKVMAEEELHPHIVHILGREVLTEDPQEATFVMLTAGSGISVFAFDRSITDPLGEPLGTILASATEWNIEESCEFVLEIAQAAA